MNTPQSTTNPDERLPLGRVVFEHKGKTYVYDTDLVTIEQGCLAEEALQFKAEQSQNIPENFMQVVESGGVDWFSKCAAALLIQFADGNTPVPFSPSQWMTSVAFVQKLPYREHARLRECIEDFFSGTARQSVVSFLFKTRSNTNWNRLLSGFMKTVSEKHSVSRNS